MAGFVIKKALVEDSSETQKEGHSEIKHEEVPETMSDHLINLGLIQTINEIFEDFDPHKSYSSKLYGLVESAKSQDETDILKLLGAVTSFYLDLGNPSSPFVASIQLADGSRSANLEDLTEDNIVVLQKLQSAQLHVYMLARISDVLWVATRNHISAQNAIKCYLELFALTFDLERWPTCVDFIKRANMIALELGRKNTPFLEICDFIEKQILVISSKETKHPSLVLSLIELQIGNDYGDFAKKIDIIDPIIDSLLESCPSDFLLDSTFEVQATLLKKIGQTAAIPSHYLKLAKFYEKRADELWENDKNGVHNVIHSYELAIKILRQNGFSEEVLSVRRKVEPLKQARFQNMHTISSAPFDASEIHQRMDETLKGATFQDAVIALIFDTYIHKRDEMKERVLSKGKFFTQHFFATTMLDNKGQVAVVIPPLDFRNPEGNPDILEMHIHRESAFYQGFTGEFLKIFIEKINKTKSFSEDDLSFIVDENAIIPQERRAIIKFALYQGLKGNYYAALHILLPQIENIFREIAYECGSIVTILGDDFTEQAKPLGSVFDLEELVDCYDNDILFTLKGLLNEKSGSNLRNLISHGLLDSNHGSSGVAIYALCLCLRIFSFYSHESATMIQDRLNKPDRENCTSDASSNEI